MICNIDILYGFIHECTYLINNLYELDNYGHLVLKLCNEFVFPRIIITKEYNTHIKETKDVDSICLYLMYICAEKYFNLTQDKCLELKKFIDNNIYTVEAILAPMHEFFYLSKKCYDGHCYCPCNCHCKTNNRKCICLTDKYIKFCKDDSIILKKVIKSYFNAEYVKYFIYYKKLQTKLFLKN